MVAYPEPFPPAEPEPGPEHLTADIEDRKSVV